MYQILSEDEYTEQVKKMLTWGKTSLDTLEHDDLSITSQIMESSLFLGRVTSDEAHVRFALEQKRSLTKEKLRQACNTNTATKAPSEAKLDSLVELDEDVQKLESEYADLKGRVVGMKTLRDVKVGETAVVSRIHGEGALKRRIMDMGITKNTDVYVRKVAPLGDPIEVTVRNYELSLRKADAEMIEVEEN